MYSCVIQEKVSKLSVHEFVTMFIKFYFVVKNRVGILNFSKIVHQILTQGWGPESMGKGKQFLDASCGGGGGGLKNFWGAFGGGGGGVLNNV